MNRISIAALAVTILLQSHAAPQEKYDAKELAKLAAPGPEHDKLRALEGTWFLMLEVEGGFAGQPGTAIYKSVLGGRFVTEEVKLPLGGRTFEWIGIYGFDGQKKKYTAVWVDNMDTTTESGEGDADAAGKAITFKGKHIDPRTGKDAPFVWRLTRDGETKLRIEMFEVDAAGKEKHVLSVRGEKAK